MQFREIQPNFAPKLGFVNRAGIKLAETEGRLRKRYGACPQLLEDVLDGLFHIAASDGAVTGDELAYLERVCELAEAGLHAPAAREPERGQRQEGRKQNGASVSGYGSSHGVNSQSSLADAGNKRARSTVVSPEGPVFRQVGSIPGRTSEC